MTFEELEESKHYASVEVEEEMEHLLNEQDIYCPRCLDTNPMCYYCGP